MGEPGFDLAELLDEQEHEALVGLLNDLWMDEQTVKPINESIAQRRDRLKRFHESHPEGVIADFERGIVAGFTSRSAGASIDLIALSENHPDAAGVLLKLAGAGLLTASLTPLRALKGKAPWADSALSYLDPGGSQVVLKIEKAE
jgi:hypothetical protein